MMELENHSLGGKNTNNSCCRESQCLLKLVGESAMRIRKLSECQSISPQVQKEKKVALQ